MAELTLKRIAELRAAMLAPASDYNLAAYRCLVSDALPTLLDAAETLLKLEAIIERGYEQRAKPDASPCVYLQRGDEGYRAIGVHEAIVPGVSSLAFAINELYDRLNPKGT